MSSCEKIKALFSDLGKPTMRGVRKCQKCGTFNGTRSLICKNKLCDVVFKEEGLKKKVVIDAVKIQTATIDHSQLFSVRVREKGPDYRGFVHIPHIQVVDGEASNANLIAQTAASCLVDSCQRAQEERNGSFVISTCCHIKAAFDCVNEAKPLGIDKNAMDSLHMPSGIEEQLFVLAGETGGPLIQRVSKNVMVVKCKKTSKDSLGYLHISFFEQQKKSEMGNKSFKVFCACRPTKVRGNYTSKGNNKDCLHYYACMCAFASEPTLAQEFCVMNMDVEPSTDLQSFDSRLTTIWNSGDKVKFPRVLEVSSDGTLIEPEADSALSQILKLPVSNEDSLQLLADSLKLDGSKKNNIIQLSIDSDGVLTTEGSERKRCKRPPSAPPDERVVTHEFRQWLASVTEKINQTMHYQFSGTPDALVFHAPQEFFECLQERFSPSGKKREPDLATLFKRKAGIPLGSFMKYTYFLRSIPEVKRIFDTAQVPLAVTKTYVENRDGSYDIYEPKDSEESRKFSSKNGKVIKPLELKTFLKVGQITSSGRTEVTPFIIEWIPDILPITQIGEMRVKFEFGHYRTGYTGKRN